MTRTQAPAVRETTWLCVALPAAAALLATVGAMYLFAGSPGAVHTEGGPLEILQLGVWYGALTLLVVAAARGPTRFDRVGALWLYAIAGLATMRELDLHLWPSPANLGEWGMHFRTRWWLNFDVPLAPKLLWGCIGLLLLAVIVGPVVCYARRALPLLWRRDGAAMLLVLSMAFCFGGFAADDLLRHPDFISEEALRGIEEVVELLGAASFAGIGAALLARPLSRRAPLAGEGAGAAAGG